MAAGNCSVEATIIKNGKNVKGTLTLFIDEYSFDGKRTAINWEKAECKERWQHGRRDASLQKNRRGYRDYKLVQRRLVQG